MDLVLLELVELKVIDNLVLSVLSGAREREHDILLNTIGAIGRDGHGHPLAMGS